MHRGSGEPVLKAAAEGRGDVDLRAVRHLTILMLAGFVCAVLVFIFMISAAIQAVKTIDHMAEDREIAQVTLAVAAAPGGMNEITLAAIAGTLDLDHPRLTTTHDVRLGELTVSAGADRLVAWIPHNFGSMAFQQIAPLRIAGGTALVLLMAGIGWRVVATAHALDRGRRTASRQARTDTLTGLGNRLAFNAGLANRFAALAAGGPGFAPVSVDLDGFKAINDTLGHAAGDEVLKAVAVALREAAGRDDLVARIGGDEFVVLRPDTGVDAFVTDALARISRPTVIAEQTLRLAASIGVARSNDFATADSLTNAADSALYRAKRAGNGLAEIAVPPPAPRRAAA